MSKVTVLDLVSDYNAEGYEWRAPDGLDKIEIVPRKIVEMIIDECEIKMNEILEKREKHPDYFEYYQGEFNALYDMKKYAESLLEQFEEDKK